MLFRSSVKELKDRGKAAEREFAYQSYLAQISKSFGPEKAAEVKKAMDAMPKMLRDSVVEQKLFGNIRNDQGRLLSSIIPGFVGIVDEIGRSANNANLNLKTYEDIIGKNNKVFEEIMGNQTLQALAGANTKYAETIIDPNYIAYYLERALYLALTDRKGPVWLDVPLNIQSALIDEHNIEIGRAHV